MSKCKAVLDGDKITAIQVKAKPPVATDTSDAKGPDQSKSPPPVAEQPSK